MEKYYNIALDLGTNSVGWAAIGPDYKVVKKGDKHLWGVVLFDKGESAKDRRVFRSTRRRFDRRRKRIELLRMLMAGSIGKEDPTFFRRLDSSFLCNKNKDPNSTRQYHYNIFNDTYTDKIYYKKYPTIYHLRKTLMESDEKADIRLIYLAIHHIIKYRGNFLHDEDAITISGAGVISLLEETFSALKTLSDDFLNADAEAFYRILSNKNLSKKDRQKELLTLIGNTPLSKVLVSLLLGYKVKSNEIVSAFSLSLDEDCILQFGTDDTEEQLATLSNLLNDDQIDFLNCTYKTFFENNFIDILGEGNVYVSDLMIQRYEKHKQDLKLLKNVLVQGSDEYKAMFRSPRHQKEGKKSDKENKSSNKKVKVFNYACYVKTNTKQTRYQNSCTQEEFYDYVKKVLSKFEDSANKTAILNEIEKGSFMPRINDITNAAIPYQFNKNELVAILDKQGKYYPEFYNNKDKIISLLTFKRPYSVGVLKGPFSWIDQTIDGTVYPWDFEQKVDYDIANANFIKKMLSKDPFFDDQYVLPKDSITYQKYVVLNELNNIRIKGKPLDVTLKQRLFDDLVCQKTTVSKADIIKFINVYYKGVNIVADDIKLSDDKLLGSMRTLVDFKKILGNDFTEKDIPLYDKIVESIAIFNDIKVRQKVINNLFEYKPYLRKYTVLFSKKRYSKWGRYSYRTLVEELSEETTPRSILDIMYQTQYNINEILYGKEFGFIGRTVGKQEHIIPNYENLIDSLYADASVKKTVWQAYKVVREIIEIIGNEPDHIFVETTKEDDIKKKKDSRKKLLDYLYSAIQTDVAEYNATLKEIKKQKSTVAEELFSNEKVFLYFLQMGRCMYSGTSLSLDHLSEYEVDHIIPRSLVKNDSIDNKVLVLKQENQRKKELAISFAVRKKMQPFWAFLKANKMISGYKYNNLMKDEYTDKDVAGFINRQLVETTQANSCFQQVIKTAFPDRTDYVLPIRAGLSREFRKKMVDKDPKQYGSFIKIRSLNDFHHAKDAYLAAVLGTFTTKYYRAWGNDDRIFATKKIMETMQSENEFKKLLSQRYSFILDLLENGDYEPTNSDGEPIPVDVAFENICRQMDYNDIAVFKVKERQASNAFYNMNPLKAGEGKLPLKYVKDANGNSIPLDPALYGGYSGEQDAYFVWISYDKGKKRETRLEGIPALIATQAKTNDQAINDYFVSLNLKNFSVESVPVYKNQLIKLNGQLVYIVASGEVANATQLVVDKKYHKLLKIAETKKYAESDIAQLNEDAVEFVTQYVEKLEKYYGLYKTIAEKVTEFLTTGFTSIDLDDKLTYISNLLVVTKSGSSRINMPKEWNGGSDWGRLSGKTIYKKDVHLYHSSITGYYKK